MNWMELSLRVIDEDGLPAVMECVYEGKVGYAIIAFTDDAEANRYKYLSAPNLDMKFLRVMTRKRIEDRMIQVDLVRCSRAYHQANLPHPVLAMVINPAAPIPTWVSMTDLITHGRKQRQVKTALQELDG